jgi:hypothetical protein
MRRTSLHILRSCRPYFFRESSGSAVTTPAKSVPLRIFAVDQGAIEAPTPTAAIEAEKEKRYQEWLEKRRSQAPSDERLNDEFKKRAGFNRRKGLLARARLPSKNGQKSSLMLPRMRRASVALSNDRVAPADLLQPSEDLDTDESIFAAIDSCISAAVERLELLQSTNRSELTGSPPKAKVSIPHDQFIWLCNILEFQFTKSQLVHYGYKCGLTKTRLNREKTPDGIKMILEKVWNIEKEAELPVDETLVTKSIYPNTTINEMLTSDIPVSRRELFFMIGEGS